MMVFSKIPVTNWQRVPKSSSPHASFEIAWPGGQPCKVFVVHPSVPTTEGGFVHRARAFDELAAVIGRQSVPVIVFGDFNSTWASKDFRKFCRASGLLPATDFLPSWHAGLPGIFQIPIDHILASAADFSAIRATSGHRGFGSDHLPVQAEISLKAREPIVALAETRSGLSPDSHARGLR
jgi:endonuclease/exonuclease/phosphatase (EEP) superfamily protein YafD